MPTLGWERPGWPGLQAAFGAVTADSPGLPSWTDLCDLAVTTLWKFTEEPGLQVLGSRDFTGLLRHIQLKEAKASLGASGDTRNPENRTRLWTEFRVPGQVVPSVQDFMT